MEQLIRVEDSAVIQELLGGGNSNVRIIEETLPVEIEPDLLGIRVRGKDEKAIEKATDIIHKLLKLQEEGVSISKQLSSYVSQAIDEGAMEEIEGYHPGWICLNAKGKPIVSKSQGQSKYVDAIKRHTVTFAVGPAGTGKTYLAVAMAVQAFRKHEVERIILTRPAVEAGERLGFLPGDLQTKVDPYMRPLYDSLQDLMGAETYLRNMEKGLIEVSPLAYMRGRTLDNAFIILDEAQNTSIEQMKMFLTRIGFDSKVVVTGDVTQIDLPREQPSGLVHATRALRHVEGLNFIELSSRDIVRNPIVSRIIKAYDKHGENKSVRREREDRPSYRGRRDNER